MSNSCFKAYAQTLQAVLSQQDWLPVSRLADDLAQVWREGRQVFICGNGGSAANAIHIANDLLYGAAKENEQGVRITALPANQAVMTCLANDLDYKSIYAHQLAVLGKEGDLLIVLSGSGNSPNILAALAKARESNIKSYAILGYGGGQALTMADNAIHFAVEDMQIAEDCQLVVGHMVMRSLLQSVTD